MHTYANKSCKGTILRTVPISIFPKRCIPMTSYLYNLDQINKKEKNSSGLALYTFASRNSFEGARPPPPLCVADAIFKTVHQIPCPD
mmetsp:Transcript_20834/g.47291  ORF Transcript_20834/g.47291 Transcript_20834/m.47291 type:complete len:87 (-) Transcript_20834:247-507(-)